MKRDDIGKQREELQLAVENSPRTFRVRKGTGYFAVRSRGMSPAPLIFPSITARTSHLLLVQSFRLHVLGLIILHLHATHMPVSRSAISAPPLFNANLLTLACYGVPFKRHISKLCRCHFLKINSLTAAVAWSRRLRVHGDCYCYYHYDY